ncbi:MAG: 2,3-diaminopropionate biosynthesis protein SbnA [Chloroflexota bacterium]
MSYQNQPTQTENSFTKRQDYSIHDCAIQDDGILAAVGTTPMVKLNRIFPHASFNLYAKLEMLNPGGSIKDRVAVNMLKEAWDRGDIGPSSTIIESSSGNLGIGLAQACAVLGLRFICVVDPKTTPQNLNLLKAYGAEVDMVSEPDPVTKDFLTARIQRVKSRLAMIPNSFWCNQYANQDNPGAHHHTFREILEQCDGKVDYLFCATSSCGTLRGCADYIQQMGLETKIIAADAKGSIIFGGPRGKRFLPGHGAGRIPEHFQPGLQSDHVYVSDIESVLSCRRLLKSEGILAGGSSGAVIHAIGAVASHLPAESTCVAVLCDRGERYLDMIYDDKWVEQTLGYRINDDYSPSAVFHRRPMLAAA